MDLEARRSWIRTKHQATLGNISKKRAIRTTRWDEAIFDIPKVDKEENEQWRPSICQSLKPTGGASKRRYGYENEARFNAVASTPGVENLDTGVYLNCFNSLYSCLFHLHPHPHPLYLHNMDFVFYYYAPSGAAGGIFTALFGVCTLLHIYQVFRTRTWFMIPFNIGSACMSILSSIIRELY